MSKLAIMSNVSACLDAFYRATVEMGIAQNVTAFTQSDFGRTLTSNGDGTDHAWGGVQLVVGGAVRGRNIYGNYPVLRLGATLAADGADDADLARIAPGIDNFTQRDLGFMT